MKLGLFSKNKKKIDKQINNKISDLVELSIFHEDSHVTYLLGQHVRLYILWITSLEKVPIIV